MLTRKEQIQIDLVEARAKKDLLYARFVREMDLNNEHIKELENELANIEQYGNMAEQTDCPWK